MSSSLDGRRVVCIGASAGIGRAFAARAIADGAQLLAVARRQKPLDDLCAGSAATTLSADAARSGAGLAIAAAAHAELGEVDLVFASVGSAPLKRLSETSDSDWESVLQTNLLGTHRVIRALLPLLRDGAIVAVLSSESVGEARAGLAAYSASKAALEQLMRSYRGEHPRLRFVTVVVGGTTPTEFSDAFDPALLRDLLEDWAAHGQLQTATMPTDEVAGVLEQTLAALLDAPGVGLEQVVLRSPAPPVPPGALAAMLSL